MPIGSFETAWENYDHTSGPALINQAKSLEKVGSKAPNWRLTIGGEDFSRRLVSAEVTYSKEGGSSISFAVMGNLRAAGYERATVRFWIGYGTRLVPYFAGRLAEPVDTTSGLSSEAVAYGLSTQLGAREFQKDIDYSGFDLREAVQDLWDYFGALDERLDFWGTHTTTLTNKLAKFGYEHTLSEALEAILEPMQFIYYDQISGILTIKRSHLASLGTDEVFSGAGHYLPAEYPKDGFTFSQSQANFYDDVTIFRRNEDYQSGGGTGVTGRGPEGHDPTSDEYAVFVDKYTAGDSGVADPGPFHVNEGRDFVVPDYPGEQEHAERERGLLITALSRGVGDFEWTPFPCDYDLGDHLTVYQDEQTHDPAYLFSRTSYRQSKIERVGYACVVEEQTFTMAARQVGSVAVDAEAWSMRVAGKAFEKERETLRAMGSPITIDLGVAPSEVEEPGAVVGAGVTTSGGDSVVTSDGDRVVV